MQRGRSRERREEEERNRNRTSLSRSLLRRRRGEPKRSKSVATRARSKSVATRASYDDTPLTSMISMSHITVNPKAKKAINSDKSINTPKPFDGNKSKFNY